MAGNLLEISIRSGTVESILAKRKNKAEEKELNVQAKLIPSIFSEERIRLLKEINGERNVSILSKLLNRHIGHISRDLAYLEKYGIIKFEKRGREKIPMMRDHELIISI